MTFIDKICTKIWYSMGGGKGKKYKTESNGHQC